MTADKPMAASTVSPASSSRPPAILQSRTFLYTTEFFAGMSVMAVELGAVRLLAPFFSSSQIVWTIIIGTIMIAMALGNLWGGRAADRNPDPDRLYVRLLAAALWIAAIPVVGKYIIIAIAGGLALLSPANYLIWAAFTAAAVLFVFPLMLLGTVTPSLVKYTTDSLDDNGRIVGNLNALNTIGSIIGTFIPTFFTIPAVGTSMTFLIFASILLLICLLYFFAARRRPRLTGAALLVLLLCSFLGHSGSLAFWDKGLLYEGESLYNYLQVKETPWDIRLGTNVLFGVQSIRMKSGELTGMYYDYALAAPFMAGLTPSSPGKVLILGLGSGTYASQINRYFPHLTVTGVEIDGKIIQLAHDYFSLPEKVKTVNDDGRAFLANSSETYDVIMVDAYQDITIPFQLSSAEFFQLLKSHLTPNGVMVVNLNMHSNREGSLNQYLSDTIASVFPSVTTVTVPNSTNRELFASSSSHMREHLRQLTPQASSPRLMAMMSDVEANLIPYHRGPYLLTDDKAPVEMLGMQVIDELIQDQLNAVVPEIKERGIREVLFGH